MAKSPKPTNGTSTDATVTVHLPADFTIAAHGHSLSASDVSGMSPKALAYLVANGYKQSLTDAAAFTKEQKSGKSGAELEDMANTKRASRHAAILAGDVGAVVGSRATPLERFERDVAEERVRAIAVNKGVPMPKGDVLKAAIAKVRERFADDVKAEATARMAAAKAAASEAEDILG